LTCHTSKEISSAGSKKADQTCH
jgi:hypothetical protein